MTESLRTMPAAVPATPRRGIARTAAAMASGGLIVGMGTVAAVPAMAATPADCDGANTLTSPANSAGDIQNLLTLNTPIVCLSGTFALAVPLTFDHDVTFFGLTNAGLDGQSLTQILNGTDGAALTIQNLSFVNGSATQGGAIYHDGAIVVENSTFTSNTAVEDGGAIYVDGISGSPVIEIIDSTFTSNATGDGLDGYSGGAIFAGDAGSFTIEGSTFTSNSASEFGGAVYGFGPLVSDSTFTTNTALLGGGLYGFATAVFESTFVGNDAVGGGGVFGGGYAAAFGSTFDENAAEEAGGAIASYGELEILNSTFVENTAESVGGAVFGDYGRVGLSTFLNNEADDPDLGNQSDSLFMIDGEGVTEVAGNVFAGSRSNAHLGAVSPGKYDDLGGNVFSTSEATEDALGTPASSTLFSRSIASIFGPGAGLADNGGASQTVALVAGSPAIDAVPPFEFSPTLSSAGSELQASAALQAAVDTSGADQRDVVRTGLADAGSFEFGDAELAATGGDSGIAGWLAAMAALLLGSGAAVAIGARRRSRSHP